MDSVFSGIMKALASVFRVLYRELWKKPKDIRGLGWTLTFYAHVLLGFAIATIVCEKPGGWQLVLAYIVVTALLNHLNGRPVRLGRPLPYGRRRR